MFPRPEVSEERRNQILEAAMAVFARQGFEKECDPWRLRIVAGTRIYRWLANTPRWFYRLGLGWLFGQRVAQITHRGHKSGQIRRTILEVLRYDPQTREVLVVSGWQGKTDWYRNIEREPALEVRIGRVHYRPAQEFLTLEETAELILTLFRQHPRQVRFVGRFLGIDPEAEDAVLRARLEAFFRGVRFRPAHEEEYDRRAPGLQSSHSSPRNHRCWKGQHRASPHGRRATRFPAGG